MKSSIALANAIAHRREDCEQAIAQLERQAPQPSTIRSLRRDFGDELAHRLLALSKLQSKARLKFGEGLWWVTQRSLQQATAWQIAAWKSKWLLANSGSDRILDLCCGIGGDAMQLVAGRNVMAVDADPVITQFAAANLSRVSSSHTADVICQDVLDTDLPTGCTIHIDPDRRAHERRTSDPDRYSPAWSDVRRLIDRSGGAVVKLAPTARLESPVPNSHRCWISLRGEVREQTLVCGQTVADAKLAPDDLSAVIVNPDGSFHQFVPSADRETFAATTSLPQECLVDPDAAIRAAGLTESFAAQHGISMLGGPAGFLTGRIDQVTDAGHLATVARVLWHGSADDRKIRRELRQRNLFPEVIKVRGTGHDPAVLSKRYRKCGDLPASLWFGRTSERVFAALVERRN